MKRRYVAGARNKLWKMHKSKWWRLILSPVDTNEFLSLELPGAWEPLDSSRAYGNRAS